MKLCRPFLRALLYKVTTLGVDPVLGFHRNRHAITGTGGEKEVKFTLFWNLKWIQYSFLGYYNIDTFSKS